LGDVISIQVNPMVGEWSTDQGAKTAVRRGPVAENTTQPFSSIPLWPIFLVLGLLGLFMVIWLFRRRTNAPLSADEKQAFADRLKTLLEDEARNGRSTV
ncbi:MAG: hypothetical protein RL481_1606, partial [Pseudomonadota bacterium]